MNHSFTKLGAISFEVLKLCLEVAPLNMEARDDINLSIQQLLNQNSSGIDYLRQFQVLTIIFVMLIM